LPAPPKTILDLGGGVGRFAIPIAQRGYTVLLYDISVRMLEEARRLAVRESVHLFFKKGSVRDLSALKPESYDAIICMNYVLDYCENYSRCLSQVYRVLKPEGTFIGSVANIFMTATANELKAGDIELFIENMRTHNRHISWCNKSEGHLTHEFTHQELLLALQRAGFTKIEILGVFNLLGKYFQPELEDMFENPSFFQLQLDYAQKREYINNSTDFFFVCSK
jgi:ubiquinone/menaquinone biosynthesis C-methylase UbiE